MDKMAKLRKTLAKDSRRIIGLMSGMSMDGIDLALVDIRGHYPDIQIQMEDCEYCKYDEQIRQKIRATCEGTVRDVCQIEFLVGEAFAACVNAFLRDRGIGVDTIDAIGSHGQTIYYIPQGSEGIASTLQVGSGQVIAERTGIPTVFNFRIRDMAAGGNGAPLIPILDYLLHRQPGRIVALNNLGSISNLTIVTPDRESVLAFDTGPANMPIDYFAERIPGNKDGIDRDGRLSAQGQVQDDVLEELMSIPFLSKSPPKAAGFHEFGPQLLDQVARKYSDRSIIDLLRTAVEFSARSIVQAYHRFVLPRHPELHTITFTGGGSRNVTLMERIERDLAGIKVIRMSEVDQQMNDFKEAMGFAVLANETLSGRAGNIPGATGARYATILGDIAP
jgi:anhydro-N-acetylmuramic acid kinase